MYLCFCYTNHITNIIAINTNMTVGIMSVRYFIDVSPSLLLIFDSIRSRIIQ